MADSDTDRPGSRGYHGSPVPRSPRISVATRDSRSSLRREQERQDDPVHPPRPVSVAYSRPDTPHSVAAVPVEQELAPPVSPPPHPQLTHPTFSPVFTLLSSTSHSSNRQTTHHPTVHYIFADDDPEILTAALAHHQGVTYDDSGDEGGQPDTPDRGVLLDMEPTADGSGLEVAWASSLTPDWAATSAHLSRMQGGNGGAAAELGANLVLKIEGMSIEPSSGSLGKAPTPETEMQSSGGSAGLQQEEYPDLLYDFEKRMSTLRKVVEAGAARQRALGDGGGQFSQGTVKERAAAPFRPEPGGDGAEGRGGGQ